MQMSVCLSVRRSVCPSVSFSFFENFQDFQSYLHFQNFPKISKNFKFFINFQKISNFSKNFKIFVILKKLKFFSKNPIFFQNLKKIIKFWNFQSFGLLSRWSFRPLVLFQNDCTIAILKNDFAQFVARIYEFYSAYWAKWIF